MNIDALKADLAAKKTAIESLMTRQSETAQAENRDRTPEERAEVDRLIGEARQLRTRVDRAIADANLTTEIARLTDTPAVATLPAAAPRAIARKTWGQQFVESASFAWLKQSHGGRMASWSSPVAELAGRNPSPHDFAMLQMLATTITSDPASGGALVPPDYLPGLTPLATRPVVVADLIAPGTTDSNLVTYMLEKAITNAAAAVAEGALKPESAITFAAAQDAVRKIATWLPVTDEMLEDAPQLRSYIDSRLAMFVQLAEDDQLLNGDGVAPNILGIRNRPDIADPVPRGTDTNEDAILKQITAIATTAYIQPDGIVMNPANWLTIQLRKSQPGGLYIAGGPFAPVVPPRLWGLPVAITTAEPEGISTVGAYAQASQFFRRGGLRVEASNSHADFFVKNLTAIRAEERGALAVYRPGAFGDVTGLD